MLLEQFCILPRKQIHYGIGVSQEGIYNMKPKKLQAMLVCISKAYDRENWLYLGLLIHIGFNVQLVN